MTVAIIDAQVILARSTAGVLAREVLESAPEAGSVTQKQRHDALTAMIWKAVVETA